MKPRATWQDAYDAQMALWRWYRTEQGRLYLRTGYAQNAGPLGTSSQHLLAGLYATEERKVLQADPIFVSSEMCEVIEAATAGFKPEPLLATDLLTGEGFCWFERPFQVLDRFDEPLNIRAFSWCLLAHDPDSDEDAIEWAGVDDNAVIESATGQRFAMDGIAVTLYSDWVRRKDDTFYEPPGHVAPSHLTPWWFGMEFDGNEVDEHGEPTGAAWWWRIAQVTLRLMQQRIAVRHQERPTRPQRREGRRVGFDALTDDREVMVVRLRREQGERHDPSGESANYSHRFIVGGHWRNQWYPSGRVHRQIWISPYVKGPEDLPLVVKPRRAFTWDR